MVTHRSYLSVLAAISCLAWTGCNRAANTFDATVQGAVTIDGELAPRGTVTFHPIKNGTPSSGPIHEDGSYSIRTGQGDLSNPDGGTIRSGDYVVTVAVTAPPSETEVVAEGGPPSVGARLMADKYAMKETSDLKVKVKAGPNIIDLKLDGPWANPPKEEAEEEGDQDAEEGEAKADKAGAADGDASDSDARAGEEVPTDAPADTVDSNEQPAETSDTSADVQDATTPADESAPQAGDEPASTEGQP
jgi:hypothetical protein